MYSKWQSDTKIKIVQNVLANILDSINHLPNIEIGIRTMGNTKERNMEKCLDTRLETPFLSPSSEALHSKLKALVPKGYRPLEMAIEKGGMDFPGSIDSRNIIIIISDGVDNCGGRPWEVSKRNQEKGLHIKPFVIGLSKGLSRGLAEIGIYYETSNEIDFTNTINDIVNLSIHNTSCQVNILDINDNPTETDVAMVFYDSKSKQRKYSFFHTMNPSGLSDTLCIDPLINYDLDIFTIPPIRIENIGLEPGKHSIITAKSPQGNLVIEYAGTKAKNESKKDYKIPIIIRKDGEVINSQKVGIAEKYQVGKYDVDIYSLPNIELRDVEIRQSSTTSLKIPEPGMISITKKIDGIGVLFIEKQGRWEFVSNLYDDMYENIVLLPGKYLVVFRDKDSESTLSTITREFIIESGLTTKIIIENK